MIVKIGIVQPAPWHPTRERGSLETLMTSLSRSVAQKHEVVLYAPLYDDSSNVSDWSLRDEGFSRVVAPAWKLPSVIKEGGHDLISVHNIPGAVAGIDVPVALFLHGRLRPDTGWPGLIAGRPSPLDLEWEETMSVIKRAERLAAPSMFAASFLSEHSREVDVVYPIVHPDYLKVAHDEQTNRVAWIGRATHDKGLPFLVENSSKWSFQWSWSTSGFYGDINEKTLESLPGKLEPCQSRAEMLSFFACTKVVLCPYVNEGLGMVATEAAAAGCRVVGFADGGLRETAVAPHINLVPRGDVRAFNDAVIEALEAGVVSAADRLKVFETFSPSVSGALYLEHLRLASVS